MVERRIQKREKETGVVQWGGYDEEALEGHEDELDEKGSSEFEKLEAGRHRRRILPPPKGSGWGKNGADSPMLVVWQHAFMVGEKMIKFACPKKESKEPCFACDESARMRRSAIPAEKDKGYEIRAKQAAYLQWFDPEEKTPEIKIYEAGKTVRTDLIDLRREKGDYSDARKGYDIVVKRKGSTRTDTSYSVYPGDPCPMSDFDFTPDDLIDLEAYAVVPTEEEQEGFIDMIKEFIGFKEPKASRSRRSLRSGRDEDEEERPRRGRRGRSEDKPARRSRRSVPQSYDPDEDEGEIIDVEPEEERPRGRRGRRKR